jgi:transposase
MRNMALSTYAPGPQGSGAISRVGEDKREKFYEEQKDIRAALMITAMILDEGEATLDSIALLYGLSTRTARAALRMADDEGFVQCSKTDPDGTDVFVATRKGWRTVLLTWIARHGVASEENLEQRFAISKQSGLAGRFMKWGVSNQLLRTIGVMRSEPELVVATRKGLKQTGWTILDFGRPAPRTESHERVVSTIAVRLELLHRYTHDTLTEREIYLLQGGPDTGSKFDVSHVPPSETESVANPVYRVDRRTGDVFRKRSDLLLAPRDEEHEFVGVEVELSPRDPRTLEGQLDAWAHCETVGQVIYYVAPDVFPRFEKPWEKAIAKVLPRSDLEEIDAARVQGGDTSTLRRKLSLVVLDASEVPGCQRKKEYELHQIPGSREYFRALQPEAGRRLLVDLLAIVDWVGLHGFTPVDAIATKFGYLESEACHLLLLAHGAGWLEFTTMLREEDALFHISAAGRKVIGRTAPQMPRRRYSTVLAQAMSSRLAAVLECEFADREAKARFEIRNEISDQLWEDVGTRQSKVGARRIPDMILTRRGVYDLDPIAVLIEPRTPKESVLEDTMAAYAAAEQVGKLLYYICDDHTLWAAKRMVNKLGVGEAVIVRSLPLSKPARERQIHVPEPGCFDADCRGEDHTAREEVDGWPFRGVTDETWAQVCEEFPDYACGPKRPKDLCRRRALNGVLAVLASREPWKQLPTKLGFGTYEPVKRHLDEMRKKGEWPRVSRIVARSEQQVQFNWERVN